jgi:hypothetical protein
MTTLLLKDRVTFEDDGGRIEVGTVCHVDDAGQFANVSVARYQGLVHVPFKAIRKREHHCGRHYIPSNGYFCWFCHCG